MADAQNAIDIVVQNSVDPAIAPRLITIADASDTAAKSLGTLKAQLAQVGSSGLSGGLGAQLDSLRGGTASLSRETGTLASTTRAASSATQGFVSANVSAAAALGITEGRTLSMNRAAADFITKILGLGPILQQAFVVIGAAALLSVVYQAYEAFDKFLTKAKNAASILGTAFDGIIGPLRKANDSLAVTNDKLDQTIAKLEHKPTTNGAALALDQAREAADRLDTELEKVSNDLDKILNKNRIGLIASIFTGQGTTGDTEKFVRDQFDTIDKVRSDATKALDTAAANKDPKAAQAATITAYANERTAIKGVIDALNIQWSAKKKLQDEYDKGPEIITGQMGNQIVSPRGQDQTANLTMLGKSAQLAQQDLRGLDGTMANIGKEATVDRLRDQTSELANETKLAATQWKALEANYIAYQNSITLAGKKPTAQQDLGFLQNQESTINSLNRDKLAAKEQPLKNTIAGEQYGNNEIAKLQAQADNMNKYGTALKEATEDDRIFQEGVQKGLPLTDQQIAKITSLVGYINQRKALQSEETKIQKEAASVETQYGLALTASAVVMKDHPELVAGITRELNKMKIAHDDALDPMLEVNRALADQRALDGQYGQELEVSTAVQELANKLRKDGITDWQQQAEAQRGALTTQNELNTAQANNKALYDETTGALDKLVDRKNALNKATETELSNEAKNSALTQNAIEQGNRRLNTGQSTSQKDIIGGVAGDLIKNYTTIAAGIKETFSGVFKTLSDGFSDSIGRAIVYSKNLGQALKDVARSAIAELISGLIKLGIQYLVLVGLKKLLGIGGDDDKTAAATAKQIAQTALLTAAALAAMATVTAAGVASATTLGAVWWPVAEAVSLASFGANAIPASAGVSTVVALGTLASVPKLDVGTNYVQRSGLAMIHEGEAVVPKQYNPAAGGQQAQSRGGSSKQVHVTIIEDHTSGAKIQVVQTSDDHIRIVARDIATQAIHAHTDSAVANAVSQPNSKTSKALRINTGTRRTR